VTFSLRYDGARALVLACAILACGCGPRSEDSAAGPVAAKVNGDDITVQQIKQAVTWAPNMSAIQQEQAQRQVLERLIDQQLLAQQAVAKKLEHDPRVIAAQEAARRQILAQAYLEQVIQSAPKSTPEEVKKFYSEHPELFSDRRAYRFKELAFAVPDALQPALRAELESLGKQRDKSKTMVELAKWLQSRGVNFQANVTNQTAEQLPIDLIGRIHQMKSGDLLVTARGSATVVSQLDASQSIPLTEEQSRPFIEQFLQNRKRMDLSSEEVKRLRSAAKIQYGAQFAAAAASADKALGGSAAQPSSATAADK